MEDLKGLSTASLPARLPAVFHQRGEFFYHVYCFIYYSITIISGQKKIPMRAYNIIINKSFPFGLVF